MANLESPSIHIQYSFPNGLQNHPYTYVMFKIAQTKLNGLQVFRNEGSLEWEGLAYWINNPNSVCIAGSPFIIEINPKVIRLKYIQDHSR